MTRLKKAMQGVNGGRDYLEEKFFGKRGNVRTRCFLFERVSERLEKILKDLDFRGACSCTSSGTVFVFRGYPICAFARSCMGGLAILGIAFIGL